MQKFAPCAFLLATVIFLISAVLEIKAQHSWIEAESNYRDVIRMERSQCFEVQHDGKRMLWYKAGGRVDKNGKTISEVEWVLLEETLSLNHHPADEPNWWSDHWGDKP